MAIVNTEAIILRTYRLAEADKIVVCFTRHAGLIRGVARGARRLKSQFGASLETWTIIALTYFEKEHRELVSISGTEILRSPFELARNVEIAHTLEYLSELIIEFAPPRESNEVMFRMIGACVEALIQVPANVLALVNYFEIWMLRLSGFLPNLQSCAMCHTAAVGGDDGAADLTMYFSFEAGLRCGVCSRKSGLAISSASREQLRLIQRLSPLEYVTREHSIPFSVRRELQELTRSLITRALEREPRGRTSLIGLPNSNQ